MTSARKEPHLTDLDHAGKQERIPTLSERAAPDLFDELQDTLPDSSDSELYRDLSAALEDEDNAGPSLDDYDFIDELTREDPPAPAAREDDTAAPQSAPAISPEDIEALSDRVLDRIAPALREAVTAAVTELLVGRARDKD